MPAIRQDMAILRLTKQVNDIWAALRRVTVNLPLFDIANENTPTQLTGDQNNYVIGNYDLLRLSSSAAVSITGLSGGIKGRFLRIFNVGSYPITLEHQSASSNAANRFKFSNGSSAAIPPSSNITIYYDESVERWIGGDVYSSGAIFALLENASGQNIPDDTVTKLDPGTVISDQYGFYDDANNQIEIQFDGVYQFRAYSFWDGDELGYRSTGIYVNSVAEAINQFTPYLAFGGAHEVTTLQNLSAGDIVEVYGYQNRGAASTILSTQFSMVRVS